MNVSYRWLQAFAPDLDASPEELAELLAVRGFPLEDIRSLAEGLDDVVVARVDAVRAHPNADRLRLCEVETGNGVVQVVCGADNVEAGHWYPFAPVGASLPGGMKIGRAKLRGEVSEGMLCSERELGLGPGQEGLMDLDGIFDPGQSLLSALELVDVRMDVEVTPNRPDLLSHEGVIREIAAAQGREFRLPQIPGAPVEPGNDLERLVDPVRVAGTGGVQVSIEDSERCPRYLGLVLRGVQVRPSPRWLQTRLRAVGARPINNVVDATNYVLLELGQPLHAFDLNRLEGSEIVVRRARKGETIRTLDGEDRTLTPDMLAICDRNRPVAVAGVIGGENSEVTERTEDVLLECAHFTPGPIRATRKALDLSTDASYRFERGVDPEGMLRALLRVVEIIQATGGGRVDGPVLDCCPAPFARASVPLRLQRIETLLGVPFAASEVRDLLVPLGFSVGPVQNETVAVEVPGFRSFDVTREVDVIEEVARAYGYDRFPESLRAFRPGTMPDHPLFELENRIRDELTAWGLLEAQTPAFATGEAGEVEILNPISTEEGFLRRGLLSGLVGRLEYNLARGNRNVRLYELGTVFSASAPGELPHEETHLGIILHGLRSPRHWSSPADSLDLWDLKGMVSRVVAVAIGREGRVRPFAGEDDTGPFDPIGGFTVEDAAGVRVGLGGRLLPSGLDVPRWAQDAWGFELRLPDGLPDTDGVLYAPLSNHPSVDRDLALLVPENLPVEEVLALIRENGGAELTGAHVFDVYRDPGMSGGLRSVAVRLRFQAEDRTLKNQEVEEAVRTVLGSLQEELGVGFRGQQD